LCIPVFFGITTFMAFVVIPMARRVFDILHPLPPGPVDAALRASVGVDAVLGYLFVAALLWLAFHNHRESGRSVRRAAVQVAWLAAVVAAVYVTFGAAGRPL
jgi:predicted secreted protein